ncbi:MAG: hypothetical protein IT204_19725 [Fimbriimonadaceae bacterium]|nr:hypothetical protein [Fimbriimonadaceae bacterium]
MRATKSLLLAGLLGSLACWGNVSAQERGGDLLHLNFTDAPLAEVADIISQEAGVSIVVHKDLRNEKVSLRLTDKTLDVALAVLAEANDLSIKLNPTTGIYTISRAAAKSDSGKVFQVGGGGGTAVVPERVQVVVPTRQPPAAPPGATTVDLRAPHLEESSGAGAGRARVYTKLKLNFAQASTFCALFGCPAVEETLTGQRRQYLPKANVSRTPVVRLGDTLNGSDELLKLGQRKRTQSDPAIRNYKPLLARDQFGDAPGGGGAGGPGGGGGGLGGGGGGLGGGGGGLGGGGGQQGVLPLPEGIDVLIGYDLLSALIVQGTQEGIDELRDIVALLDVPPQQIEVESRFVTLRADDSKAFGANWTLTNGSATISGDSSSSGGASVAFQYATGNFQVFLSAIMANNNGKVVNAPRVLTQNGLPAVVSFSQEIPIVLSDTTVTDSATTTSTYIETFDVITDLIVVPRVTGQPPNESITVVLSPTISDVAGFVDSPEGQIPIIADQTISTLVRVPDGDTIAMGGLVRKDNSVSSRKIPLLGDLPFIGALFRSNTTTTRESELLIFVTPRIIREAPTNGPSSVR